MESYKLLSFLHIATAIIVFGITFSYPFIQGAAERAGVGTTRFALRLIHRLDRFVVAPGAVLVLLFGVGLIFDDATGYSDDFPAWLELSIALYVVAFGVALAVIQPTVKRALALLDGLPENAEFPEGYKGLSTRVQMLGGMLGLAILVITFLMVWKPALWD